MLRIKKYTNNLCPSSKYYIFIICLSLCETIGANDIFIGANAIDYSNYPDCRPEFITAFEKLANKATAISDSRFKIHAPLINLTKAQIIKKGLELNVNYQLAHSCYDPVIIDKRNIWLRHLRLLLTKTKGL